MASIFDEVQVVRLHRSGFEPNDEFAWSQGACQSCGVGQMAVIAYVDSYSTPIQWLRCVSCSRGSVRNDGVISPPALPLKVPMGVKDDILLVWEEVRQCLGVQAYSAAVMMCRKLLLHIAVSQGLPPKRKDGRAPNFHEALEHLQAAGIISAPMRKWANRIKDVGNQQNHEIAPVTAEDATDVARFTEKLLELAFEMDVLFDAGISRMSGSADSTDVPPRTTTQSG